MPEAVSSVVVNRAGAVGDGPRDRPLGPIPKWVSPFPSRYPLGLVRAVFIVVVVVL